MLVGSPTEKLLDLPRTLRQSEREIDTSQLMKSEPSASD
jgi:hypothetical protein